MPPAIYSTCLRWRLALHVHVKWCTLHTALCADVAGRLSDAGLPHQTNDPGAGAGAGGGAVARGHEEALRGSGRGPAPGPGPAGAFIPRRGHRR